MRQFQDTPPLAMTHHKPEPGTPMRATAIRWTPARAPTIAADVGVPLLSALALGVLVVIAWVAISFKTSGTANTPDIILAFSLTCLTSFIILLCIERPLRWAFEEHAQMDLDGDGVIGKPEPQPEPQVIRDPILVRVHDGDSLVLCTLLDSTEVEQAKVIAFVQGMRDRGLTLEAAKRCDLSRDEWNSVIAHGAQIGLWTEKRQGVDALPLVQRDVAVNRMLQTTGF
jgi:hypothetical protein